MIRNTLIYYCKVLSLIRQHLLRRLRLSPAGTTSVFKATAQHAHAAGIICCITALIVSTSCASDSISDGLCVINADITGKEIVSINLSDLDKTVLEASENSLIGSIKDIVRSEYGYIIASRTAGTYRLMYFDLDGQYIRDIGHHGRGPGEFLDITSIFMLDDTLNVSSFFGQSILRYIITPNGYTALPPVNIEDLKYGIIYMSATPDIPDRFIVKHIWNGTPGCSTPLYGIYDRKWHVVDTTGTRYPAGGYSTSFPFSTVGENIYMAFIGSDTIFKTDGNRIAPSIVYDFGQSGLPADCKYNLIKRREYFNAHPDDNAHLFHNSSLISKDKIYAYLSTADSPLIMVYDIAEGESTFYRIMDVNGEPAEPLYMLNTPEGDVLGVFMSPIEDNPAVFNLSPL